jgi:hypothetical protein
MLYQITIVTSTFILQNNAVVCAYKFQSISIPFCGMYPTSMILTDLCAIIQPQDQRGAANGLSMTVMSLFKAVAPAGAGIV